MGARKIARRAPLRVFSFRMQVSYTKRKVEGQVDAPRQAKVRKHEGCCIESFMGEFIDLDTIEHDVDDATEADAPKAEDTEAAEAEDTETEATETEAPAAVSMRVRATEVSEGAWKIIVEFVVGLLKEQAKKKPVVRDLLSLLTVNKVLTGVGRSVLGSLGMIAIRCTVGTIPRAIALFSSASELCVVGSALGSEVSTEEAREARKALAREGQRFRRLVSHETDGNMRWLPVSGNVRVVCQCPPDRPFDDVAESLTAAGVTNLEIDFLGVPGKFPSLHDVPGLRKVTLSQMDFPDGKQPEDGFLRSGTIEKLKFECCDFERLPDLNGLTGLKTLKMRNCMLSDDDEAMESLGDPDAPPIKQVSLKGCRVTNGSKILWLPQLERLDLYGCKECTDFEYAETEELKQKILSGKLTGRLCKVLVRRLDISPEELKASTAVAALQQCGDECCKPCDCGKCSEC